MLPGPRQVERVHPNVILAVLSLAAATYEMLGSAAFGMAAVFLAGCAAVALLIPSSALATS